MHYKAYQQVLDLSGTKKPSRAAPKTSTTPKKRTKSGCLTCRARKKKCDESKVGGLCQACVRNFLSCSWPGDEAAPTKKTPELAPEVPTTNMAPMPAKLPVLPTKPQDKGADAYPSPLASPLSSPKIAAVEEKPVKLPPIKVQKPLAARKPTKLAQFVVTSFDTRRELCQIK